TVMNRLSMRPGDIANIKDFRSSERRLKASGLFNVDPTKGDMPKIVFSPPDSDTEVARNKNRAGNRGGGNSDSFRGQSPDGVRGAAGQNAAPPIPATQPLAPDANGDSMQNPAGQGAVQRSEERRGGQEGRSQTAME